ncbi:MAG: hypothetical protein QM784_12660 [Polyangiaceae bacterium]
MSRSFRHPSAVSSVSTLGALVGALTLTSCPRQLPVGGANGVTSRLPGSATSQQAPRASFVQAQDASSKQSTGRGLGPTFIVDDPRQGDDTSEQRVVAANGDEDSSLPRVPTAFQAEESVAATTTDDGDERRRESGDGDERRRESGDGDERRRESGDGDDRGGVSVDDHESTNWLHSVGRETWVYARPSYASRRLGYLRFGAKVRRGKAVVAPNGCSGRWYGIAPEGFVCANDRTATVDESHPLAAVTIAGPKREEPLPFDYVMARRGPPVFLRLARASASPDSSSAARGAPVQGIPEWLFDAPRIFGFSQLGEDGPRRLGLPGSGVAISASVGQGSTRLGITPTLELVENSGLEPVKVSDFQGLRLGDGATLPVAFVKGSQAQRFSRDARGIFRPGGSLRFREAVPLRADGLANASAEWLETADGSWVRRDQVSVVTSPSGLPSWVTSELIWIDVSLSSQTLVAYEGTSPRYVTLVSTGVDGVQDRRLPKRPSKGCFGSSPST